MTKRSLLVCLLLLVCAPAWGQSAKLIVREASPKFDLEKSLGLVKESSGSAAANRTALQDTIDEGPPYYGFFVPGADTHLGGFHFDNTIVLPDDCGLLFEGTGLNWPDQGANNNSYSLGSHLILHGDTYSTTFDGSDTYKLTTSEASATVTVVGRTVTALDQYASVQIKGGTKFTAGWYGIASVDTDNNTWTLDRTCSTGATSSTTTTAFNGTVKAATSNAAGLVLTMSGSGPHVVTTEDIGGVLTISGGSGFTAGTYRIVDADTTAGTWTLDSDATSSGSATGMVGSLTTAGGVGYFTPTLVRNHGIGTVHRGIMFGARTTDGEADTNRVTIGYHAATNNTSNGTNTGHHYFENCTFSFFDIAILHGRDLAHWKDTGNDWTGRTDNHSDHLMTSHMHFYSCNNIFVHRNNQSVSHDHIATRAVNLNGYVFYFDAGGKLNATSPMVSGSSGLQGLLYLGNQVSPNTSPYIINGFSYDTATANPQLVKTGSFWDTTTHTATVVFNGGVINGTPTDGLVNIAGGINLTLNDIVNLKPESLIVRKGGGGESNNVRTPQVSVNRCRLDPNMVPDDFIDHANSDPGIIVDFRGCTNNLGNRVFPDQRIVTGGNELTIDGGEINALVEFHTVDTESDASSDDLATISLMQGVAEVTGYDQARLTLRAAHTDRTVVLKDGTGNLILGADKTLDSTNDVIELVSDGTNWRLVSFQDND